MNFVIHLTIYEQSIHIEFVIEDAVLQSHSL